ncbi:MAG: HIT family protein [Candidatus Woesearchaeota archaeon]
MNDCIFCKIAKGEAPSSRVFENEHVVAFLDLFPVNKGHTLIIPKQHFETILDIPEPLLKELASVLKKISIAVKKSTQADGISVSQSNFRAAGQVVPHFHFHVIPRFSTDGLKHWPQQKYEGSEMQDYQKKIVSFL